MTQLQTTLKHSAVTDLHTGHWVRRSSRRNIRSTCMWWCCWHPTDTCHIQEDNLQQQQPNNNVIVMKMYYKELTNTLTPRPQNCID